MYWVFVVSKMSFPRRGKGIQIDMKKEDELLV